MKLEDIVWGAHINSTGEDAKEDLATPYRHAQNLRYTRTDNNYSQLYAVLRKDIERDLLWVWNPDEDRWIEQDPIVVLALLYDLIATGKVLVITPEVTPCSN